ncbi:MAG: RNA-guided endonuclease InsQ/TnpB family protein, partial [Leptospirillia bacterium]
RKSRTVSGTVKNVTVRRSGDRWFVSIQTEREIDTPVHPNPGIVGIDLGVARFATLSDGTVIAPGRFLARHADRLKRLQRALSRKKKGSKNRASARKKLARLHRKIADSRTDFLHKVSTAISQNHAVVVIEDLNVKGMSASASGTKECPGRNVRQKAGLNRSLLDQGWRSFVRMLEYKTAGA